MSSTNNSATMEKLTPEDISELTTAMGQYDGNLVLETNLPQTDTDGDWFRAQPSTASGAPPRLSSGRKSMKAILKSLRSPSPTPSNTISQSTAAEEEEEEDMKFLDEEQQRRDAEDARRVEWGHRAAGRRETAVKKLDKARGLVSSLAGEGKILKNQREALRAQLRAIDEQEASLDRRKHSALKTVKKYECIVAKYKAMNI